MKKMVVLGIIVLMLLSISLVCANEIGMQVEKVGERTAFHVFSNPFIKPSNSGALVIYGIYDENFASTNWWEHFCVGSGWVRENPAFYREDIGWVYPMGYVLPLEEMWSGILDMCRSPEELAANGFSKFMDNPRNLVVVVLALEPLRQGGELFQIDIASANPWKTVSGIRVATLLAMPVALESPEPETTAQGDNNEAPPRIPLNRGFKPEIVDKEIENYLTTPHGKLAITMGTIKDSYRH